MAERKRALVVGATGVVGRNMLKHLLAIGDGWEVLAVSRRKPDVEGRYEHLAVDLLDRAAARAVLAEPRGVTHVFYSAYVERASWTETVPPNLAMLENLLDAVEPASPGLAHINLMQGTKWYGNHLGPFKTPAREDDPRHMPPNFYYDQQDLVSARQRGKRWTWSAARPHAICGFATGNPMNLVMVIAVYAAISKALGMPLRHPGTEANWRALYQCTDAELLARAMTWMATEPRCANEAFNITNGDLIRWENLWPRIARHFGMEVGPRAAHPPGRDDARQGAGVGPAGGRARAPAIPYDQVAAWNFGDFVFSAGFDIISSMTKARRYGFHEVVDTEEMFLRLFDELRSARVIP